MTRICDNSTNPDIADRSPAPARSDAGAPPAAMPKAAAAATPAATSAAATPAATSASTAAASTAPGLRGGIRRGHDEAGHTSGRETINSQQRGNRQASRQEFASLVRFVSCHFVTRLTRRYSSLLKPRGVHAAKQGVISGTHSDVRSLSTVRRASCRRNTATSLG